MRYQKKVTIKYVNKSIINWNGWWNDLHYSKTNKSNDYWKTLFKLVLKILMIIKWGKNSRLREVLLAVVILTIDLLTHAESNARCSSL